MVRCIYVIVIIFIGCSKQSKNDTTNLDSGGVNQIVHDTPKADDGYSADSVGNDRYDEPFDEEEVFGIKKLLISDNIDSSLIQVIDSESVIFIKPFPEDIKVMDPSDYNMGKATSEPMYSSTQTLCAALGIKIINAEKRFIQLESMDKSRLLDVTKLDRQWEIILFNPERVPKIPRETPPSEGELKYFFGR